MCALAVALAASGLAMVAPASASGSSAVTVQTSTIAVGQPALAEEKKPRRDHRHHSRKKAGKPHHAGKHAGKPKAEPKPKPVWSPKDSTVFNYPFSKKLKERFRIRRHVLAAVKDSPRGSRIRLATFTFVDAKVARALIRAHKRGVSVQVLVNRRDAKLFPPFHRLQKALGYRLRGHPRTSRELASFVRTCEHSCRGTRGNLHSKIFLFSQVGHTHWVSMVGSANLTKFAAKGQWNHLNTITGRATYLRLRHIFNQMRRDRPMRRPYALFTTPKTVIRVFPRPHTTPRNDPMMRVLRRVDCRATSHTGVKVKPNPKPVHKHRKHRKHHKHRKPHGSPTKHASKKKKTQQPITRRTVVRIAMYAWFDDRGDALARAVRQKWNQGCDVRVIYSVLNRRVKQILYSPSGRGRIPMRRSVTRDDLGTVVNYNHSKYLAVNGRYDGKGSNLVWAGSMNFTALGLVSDDIVVRLRGHAVYQAYRQNFRRVWLAHTSRKPVPIRS